MDSKLTDQIFHEFGSDLDLEISGSSKQIAYVFRRHGLICMNKGSVT